EELAIADALAQGKSVYHLIARIDPLCAMPIAARQLVLNAVGSLGEVLTTQPQTGTAPRTNRIDLFLVSQEAPEQLAAKCRIPTVIREAKVIAIERKAGGKKTEPPQEKEALVPREQSRSATMHAEEQENLPRSASLALENILRVDAERIDNVLNLVGELIIGKSMLQQAMNEFARRYPKEALRNRFVDAVAFQSRVLNDLQRSVMKIRMVPVEQLFRRFPRLVRDVARQCGKQAELTISGQSTELDKGLLDAIAEPLTHLVRNAIGHGIETAEERIRADKTACGTMRLTAYHQGSQVIVEVQDDGRGIDARRVKAAAIKQGLLSADEVARLSEAEILRLIFRSGFSTAEQITEVVGRGVGLDVVQSVLQRLKGSVDVDTQVGLGTTFRLRLPLTLAIIKALLFRVEQRLYAVPLNSVAEITRIRESDLRRVDRYEVLQLRNRAVSVVRLGRPPADANGSRKKFVLVMSLGDRKMGLIVDALEGEGELVIKALDDQTVATDLVSGASILGDGRVVLILNLAAIAERSSKAGGDDGGRAPVGLLLSQAERALLGLAAAGGQS
ncbi:MAG TPA: chemotaxis protein CheA, partial [Terriglobales bacterium]